MSLFRDLMFQNRVPTGFLKCEYLESTGEQWIDTGVVPASIIVYEIKYFNAFGYGWALFGAGEFSGYRGYTGVPYYVNAGRNRLALGNSYSVDIFYETEGWHEYKLFVDDSQKTWKIMYDNDIRQGIYSGECPMNNSVYLFAMNSFSVKNVAVRGECLKYFAVQKANSYIQKLIPALTLAGTTYTDGNSGEQVTAVSDKPGMYDTVSKRFFTNRGSGDDFLYQLA